MLELMLKPLKTCLKCMLKCHDVGGKINMYPMCVHNARYPIYNEDDNAGNGATELDARTWRCNVCKNVNAGI